MAASACRCAHRLATGDLDGSIDKAGVHLDTGLIARWVSDLVGLLYEMRWRPSTGRSGRGLIGDTSRLMIAIICPTGGSEAGTIGGIEMGGCCAEHYQMEGRGWDV